MGGSQLKHLIRIPTERIESTQQIQSTKTEGYLDASKQVNNSFLNQFSSYNLSKLPNPNKCSTLTKKDTIKLYPKVISVMYPALSMHLQTVTELDHGIIMRQCIDIFGIIVRKEQFGGMRTVVENSKERGVPSDNKA